ncbi:MAG: hypothetical protein ACR2PH_16055, partial [Desulfobulbia bacterium]
RLVSIWAVLFYCSLFVITPARAGDYYHACSTPGGGYDYDHDSKILTVDSGGRKRNVPYKLVNKITLSERTGFCESQKCNARFNFNSENYVTTLKITEHGVPIEINFICEVAASGLPAACNCDREVIEKNRVLRPQYTELTDKPGSVSRPQPQPYNISSYWSHNGSSVTLSAQGSERIFRYHQPRSAMKRACSNPGDVVFDGQKKGNSYSGQASIFSCSCGKLTYPVSGTVSQKGTRIILSGEAPKRDGNCNIIDRRLQTLVFDYVRQP